jgi:hypothetical protein
MKSSLTNRKLAVDVNAGWRGGGISQFASGHRRFLIAFWEDHEDEMLAALLSPLQVSCNDEPLGLA